jgi:hypothetical protein
LEGLVESCAEFVKARDREKELAKSFEGPKKERYDKSPW